MLPDGDEIHTFRSGPGCLIGADWTRDQIIDQIETKPCELGGELCTKMNHGLVIWTEPDNPLFVECRKDVDYQQFEKGAP